MNKRILVTYATRHGSTAGVAEAIGRTLAQTGAAVDVRPMQEVSDLSAYDAVVAGSAVQGGWLPEALDWVRAHRAELARKRFAAFLVCITLTMKNPDSVRAGVSNWLAPVRALVHPVSEGLFAGMLDPRKLSFTPRSLVLRLMLSTGVWQRGDRRDWNAISAWAEELAPRLA